MGYVGVSQILFINKESYLHNWPTNTKNWRSSRNSDSQWHTFHFESIINFDMKLLLFFKK